MSTSDFDSYSELDDLDDADLESEVTPDSDHSHHCKWPIPQACGSGSLARGIKGWEKQHRPDIISASEATGLRVRLR